VEGKILFQDIDIISVAMGAAKAISLSQIQSVQDGFLTLKFMDSIPKRDNPKINGIEIKLLGPHLAHAVAGGPYFAVDTNNSGSATFQVDGTQSHTHGENLALTKYIWKTGSTVLGNGVKTSLTLPKGQHTISLTVVDSGNNESTDLTTATVAGSDFPNISSISPDQGGLGGNYLVTITGTGFNEVNAVMFGLNEMTGSSINVVNANKVTVTVPAAVIAAPVQVSVKTPLVQSTPVPFTYVGSMPIQFLSGKVTFIGKAAVVRFGPDRCLYVGTTQGSLVRICFVDGTLKIGGQLEVMVGSKDRGILGIAFDPMDTKAIPDVYVSHSQFFHGESKSSSGLAINGKVTKLSGANLDVQEDIMTGLPVSDHE
jgi:IPT/TIG domain